MEDKRIEEAIARHLAANSKEKKKASFSKLIITLVIIMNTAFAIAVLWIFREMGTEPTGLIVAWFAFTTGELWLLSNVKKEKVKKHGYRDYH